MPLRKLLLCLATGICLLAGLSYMIHIIAQMKHDSTQVSPKPLLPVSSTISNEQSFHAQSPNNENMQGTISDSVHCLATANGHFVSASERREALREISHSLNEREIAEITNFLNASGAQLQGLTLAERLALKNDALDLLLRQPVTVSGLGAFLKDMLEDPMQPQGWRDYCIQGLQSQYAKSQDMTSQQERSREQALILNTFESVFRDPEKAGFRGTVLRGIDSLSRDFSGITEPAGLDSKIRSVIGDIASNDAPSLMTALRMYSAHGLTGEEERIADIALTGSTPLLRKVAQHTLEELNARAPKDGSPPPKQ